MNKRSSRMWMILIPVLLLAGCGQGPVSPRGGSPPRGVISAAQACRLVVGRASPGFFTGLERVHLVLTTYAKGEPVESQGDLSTGMPPATLGLGRRGPCQDDSLEPQRSIRLQAANQAWHRLLGGDGCPDRFRI